MSDSESEEEIETGPKPRTRRSLYFNWKDYKFNPSPNDLCNDEELLLANHYFLFFIEPHQKLIDYFNHKASKVNKLMFELLDNTKDHDRYRYIGYYYHFTKIFEKSFNKIRQTNLTYNDSKHIILTNKIMRKCSALLFEHANKYRDCILIHI
jgi:hypothetical protein